MPLVMVGLSHNTHTPVEVRERLAFTTAGALQNALDYLRETRVDIADECVLLSTCNRTELYVSSAAKLSSGDLSELLVGAHRRAEPDQSRIDPSGITVSDLENYLEERRGHRAVEHLFRVASGLDSMVLGESDIVRQLKEAYAQAADHALCGPSLNPLFHEALRVGKRARTETELARGAFSIGHAAAQLAQNIFGSLQGRTILLLGAGAMSETTARHLAASGASSVLVANRTFDRAAHLAEQLNGHAIHYEEFANYLTRADIVIASTAAPHPILHASMIEPALKARRHRPLFLIDIAVPRDIAADVAELPDVFLYDIDDLQAVVDADQSDRRQRAARAEILVHDEAVAFVARQRTTQAAAPIVSGVRAKHHAIVAVEMERLRGRSDWTPEQWRAIEAFAQSVENKTLHEPTRVIKEYAASGEELAAAKMETARELFGLTTAATTDTSELASGDGLKP